MVDFIQTKTWEKKYQRLRLLHKTVNLFNELKLLYSVQYKCLLRKKVLNEDIRKTVKKLKKKSKVNEVFKHLGKVVRWKLDEKTTYLHEKTKDLFRLVFISYPMCCLCNML